MTESKAGGQFCGKAAVITGAASGIGAASRLSQELRGSDARLMGHFLYGRPSRRLPICDNVLIKGVLSDRSQFFKDLIFKDLTMPFYGYNRPDAKVSEGVRESFRLQGMMAGMPASYFCIKAFSETDQTEDLKKIDKPTLILHGDDDRIVPVGASAMLSSKLVKGATLKVYKGAPRGLCTILKDEVKADLLAFMNG
jgi:pimeloyl-ACP methyl ester carboxylesterase